MVLVPEYKRDKRWESLSCSSFSSEEFLRECSLEFFLREFISWFELQLEFLTQFLQAFISESFSSESSSPGLGSSEVHIGDGAVWSW